MNRAQGEHHLEPRIDVLDFAAVLDLHTSSSLFVQDHLGDRCVCEHRQVWSIHVGIDVTSENGLALSIADEQIEEGGSATVFHHATVVIFESWNTYRPGSLHHSRSYWIRVLRWLDKYWSTDSAILRVLCPVPIFNMAVDLQNRFVAPRCIARLRCEEIPVVLMSTCPGHDVDARSSAKHSSHR